MINVDHVTKYYGATPAVRDLDFRIQEGECVGFLGLNGAGKTTTLRLLSCLLLPTSGRVTIRGIDAEESPHEIRKFIGFLPDQPPLYAEMTVAGFLRFAGKLRGMTDDQVEKRLPQVFDVCSLHEVASDPIANLSHGYQQRVGIAQAIIHEPALLILDEPIQGLDPVQIVEMRAMIRNLRGSHTILLSTHILSEIEQTCDRILMLHKGTVAAQGSEDQLAQRFAGEFSIELEVRGEVGKLHELLGRLEGVKKQHVQPVSGQTMKVQLVTQNDVRESISKSLVEAGFGLLSMHASATGLERIFVNLSRDQSGGQSRSNGNLA